MDMLSVTGNQIVDAQGQPVYLRGVCVGGWMNMEDFINGYPGSEHGTRAYMTEILGAEKTEFFFERFLDYMFNEDDIAYLKSLGASVVRLPLNYRQFERDDAPYQYLEKGFARLDQAIEWCGKHGLYVILDLHSVQGWQNPDWHSDNQTRHSLFWNFKDFQDRFVALWQELARHYKGNPTVAGYNVMNEPVTGDTLGRMPFSYQPKWDLINQVYRRVVTAIREIDPDHIIFLEGDQFSRRFSQLDPPFVPNLVYSSHNYNEAGFGPGKYPGICHDRHWDIDTQRQVFEEQEGTQFTRQNNVPLWVGEFGGTYNGPAAEIPDRLRAMDDQMAVFNQAGIHWTNWVYKDIHVMGMVQPAADSAYIQRIRRILDAKKTLATDFWMGWIAPTEIRQKVWNLADLIGEEVDNPEVDPRANHTYLSQAVLSVYTAGLLQPVYAHCFEGLSETQLDEILQSWTFANCRPHQALVDLLQKRWNE